VAWALFRRWLWLLWPPRMLRGWRAFTTKMGNEVLLFGRLPLVVSRIVEVTAYQWPYDGEKYTRVFYREKGEE
jgi:hypothetical protein